MQGFQIQQINEECNLKKTLTHYYINYGERVVIKK